MKLDIVVNKEELVARLQQNRDGHKAEFDKAWAGYEKAATEWFSEQLKRLGKGKTFDRYFPHPVPEDHTADYDQIIGMLNMDQADTVPLDWSMYRQFVDDEWGWTHETTATNTYYADRS